MKLLKNNRSFFAVVLSAAMLGSGSLLVTGCKEQPAQGSEQAKQYTCPMHPEVVQDKPGKCPKCGMTLVEKR